MDPQASDRELVGWKQIGQYLGLGERQAQNYEKERGLPVRRDPQRKGQVRAFQGELDEWKQRRYPLTVEAATSPDAGLEVAADADEKIGQPDPPTNSRGRVSALLRGRSLLWSLLASLLGLALFMVAAKQFMVPKRMAGWRASGKVVTALDEDGKPIWRYEMPVEQIVTPGPRFPATQVASLAEGEPPHLLFSRHDAQSEGPMRSELWCFSPQGKVEWVFRPGKTVTVREGTSYEPPFGLSSVHVFAPFAGSQERRLIVNSVHNWSYPAQVAVLDRHGRLLSEYWHRGHVRNSLLYDLDGDGRPEILTFGVNDSREVSQATLVVLDQDHANGSARNGHGQPYFRDMPTAQERAVLHFPKAPWSEHLEFTYLRSIVPAEQTLLTDVAEGLNEEAICNTVFRLDRHLKVLRALVPDGCRAELRQKGVTSAQIEAWQERAARGVWSVDGSAKSGNASP